MFKLFKKDHTVPKGLQLAFVAAVTISFLVQVGYTLYIMIDQSFRNPNLSAFVGVLSAQTAVPILMFGLAYYWNPRKLQPGERLFESLVITVTGVAASAAFMQVLMYSGAMTVLGGEHFIAYELATAAIVLVIYAAILWQLRTNKRWK